MVLKSGYWPVVNEVTMLLVLCLLSCDIIGYEDS